MPHSHSNLHKIFDFLHQVEKLKSTHRYNKTTAGEKESSAAHSWRLALMVFIIAQELNLNIDLLKALKIALVHDLPEALTGDIDAALIAEGKVSAKQKHQQETEAIKKLTQLLPSHLGKEIRELWQEYENGITPEAKFVKALDKIETLTQLAETGYKIYDKPDFIGSYGNKHIKNFPQLKEFFQILKEKLKEEFEKGGFEWKNEYEDLN